MMTTRRRFLGFSAAGMFAAAAGCQPVACHRSPDEKWANSEADRILGGKARLSAGKQRMLGYPVNMNTPPEQFFAWRRQLQGSGIGMFPFNNVGNPYRHSPFEYNTHDFERELIERFAAVYAFPAGDVWGFLSHSGTDSNMHGMYIRRTLLQGRSGKPPKCYFTCEAHYSIQILTDLLGLERVFVQTLPDGSMDPVDLERRLSENSDRPALVVATTGTTFKGAIDRVDPIRAALGDHPAYLHLDAALFGGYLPHTAQAGEVMNQPGGGSGPGRYYSIAVSCHKFFGFHSPAGLFITTAGIFDEFEALFSRVHSPDYIGHVPGTITCSRDGQKPAEFWFYSGTEARARQAADASAMLRTTDYLMEQMQTHFAHLHPNRASEVSNTIWFRKPTDRIVQKYTLAGMQVNGEDHVHVIVMPHVSRKVADELLNDLEQDRTA